MRISGITIPDNKRLEYGLRIIFGVGHSLAVKILEDAKVDPGKKSKDLSADEENAIRREMEKYTIEGDLKRDISSNVKRLKDIKAYRGVRSVASEPRRTPEPAEAMSERPWVPDEGRWRRSKY